MTNRESCERFIEGSKGNIEAAEEMLRKHLEWRHAYNLDSITEEDFSGLEAHGTTRPWDTMATWYQLFLFAGEVYWAGRDFDGVPTLTWRACKHDANRTSSENFVRYFIHTIEVLPLLRPADGCERFFT